MSIILESLKSVINLKQKEGESLQDYTKRFKTARDVMISHLGGPIVLTKYVEGMSGYDASKPDEVKKLQAAAFSQLMAFVYLDNADRQKYGSLTTGLQSQHSLGNSQYPTTVTEATNVLSNHRFNNATQNWLLSKS